MCQLGEIDNNTDNVTLSQLLTLQLVENSKCLQSQWRIGSGLCIDLPLHFVNSIMNFRLEISGNKLVKKRAEAVK